MNTQQNISDFLTLNRAKKKELCSTILSKSLSHGGIFTELWQLIQDDTITDTDLNLIYQSAMELLDETHSEKIETAINTLHTIEDRLSSMRQKEMQERKAETTGTENIFFTL